MGASFFSGASHGSRPGGSAGILGAAFRGIFAALLLVSLAACATNPITGKSELMIIPESVETQMGLDNARAILMVEDPYPDPALQRYVEEVGQRIVPHTHRPGLPYRFRVIASPRRNAFTTGGGQVFFYTGLLRELSSEAELAAILAHEIGHNAGRHVAKKVQASLLVSLGMEAIGPEVSQSLRSALEVVSLFAQSAYSRSQEEEADRVGLRYMTLAGYVPEGMVNAFRTLRDLSGGKGQRGHWIFSTHPDINRRIAAARKQVPFYRRLAREKGIRLETGAARYRARVLEPLRQAERAARRAFQDAWIATGIAADGRLLGVGQPVRRSHRAVHLLVRWGKVTPGMEHRVRVEWYGPRGQGLFLNRDVLRNGNRTSHLVLSPRGGFGRFVAEHGLSGRWTARIFLDGFPVGERTFEVRIPPAVRYDRR